MADEVTGDRAPRPEGMSDRRLAELKLAVAPGATTYDGIDPNGRCLTCGQQPCECEIGMLRDALCEIERLRADGATLTTKVDALHDALTTLAGEYETAMRTLRTAEQRADEALAAHSASFGALQTLSAALFDGEVDDYAALAEKIIARVRQAEDAMATLREQAGVALGGMVFEIQQALAVRPGEDTFERIAELMHAESDGATLREELVSGRAQWQQERDEYRQIVESSETALATLRERVKKLPSPVTPIGAYLQDRRCKWCDARWPNKLNHPDNGCLWSEVHREDIRG